MTIVDALRAALLLLVEGHSIPTMKAMSIPPQSASDVQPRVDRSVVTFDDILIHMERYTSPGDVVTLSILRDGKEQQVEVTLASRPR